MKTRSWLILIALVTAFGIWTWMRPDAEQPGRQRSDANVAVEVAEWERRDIRDIRTFTGTLFAADEFTVAPKLSGRIERVLVDIGGVVERGQLLAEMDDAEAEQDLQRARAELQVAEARLNQARSDLDLAEREFARFNALSGRGLSTEAELDSAQAAVRAANASVALAEAQVAQQNANLRAAEVRMSYTRIRADWDNDDQQRVVGERFVDPGSTVAANTPLMSILSIDRLQSVFYIPESAYGSLANGQRVTIVPDALPSERFTGEIERIAPLFQESSRQARAEASLANLDRRLKPGMFVTVEVEVNSQMDALVVPDRALVSRGDQPGVFVATGSPAQARFVPVETGIRQQGVVQLLSPLQLDGPVVVLGQQLLDNGVALNVVDDPLPGEALTHDESSTRENNGA